MRFTRVLVALALVGLIASGGKVMADYVIKDGNTTTQTVLSFVCATTKICPAQVLIDSTGAEKGTNANPVRTDPVGTTTQPVNCISGCAGPPQLSVNGGVASWTGLIPGSAQTGTVVAANIDITSIGGTAIGGRSLPVGYDPSFTRGTLASVPINISTATTTQLVALSGSTKIYITSFDVMAGGTGNFTLEYGTGSNCGTGTTTLTGAYPLTAQNGIAKGSGTGAVLVVPAGNALCALTSQAVQMSGSVSYQQF